MSLRAAPQAGESCIFDRVATYTLQLDVDYPWRHGTANNALTVTFEEACPQELEVSVTPSRVLPGLPPGFPEPWSQPSAPGSATMATVEARVKSCPTQALNSSPAASSTTANVVVTFEVHVPAAGSADAAGHLHSESRRPTGILRGQNGQKVTSCTATLDDQGMGACTVTYDAPESSGTETIVARAPGFNDAQARVTVAVPGLHDLAAVQSLFAPFYRLVGRVPGLHTDNHWGTTQTVRAAQLVARDYAQIFSASLQINDMSLPQGGLFDICGTWNRKDRCGNAPNGGHYFHRKGTSVDFNHHACLNPLAQDPDNLFGDCVSGFAKVHEDALERICIKNGGWRVPEGPIHCELP